MHNEFKGEKVFIVKNQTGICDSIGMVGVIDDYDKQLNRYGIEFDNGWGGWYNIEDFRFVAVHVGHCCVAHGCKYVDDEYCPVAKGKLEQKYRCEICCDLGIKSIEDIHAMIAGEIETCPHCQHVL